MEADWAEVANEILKPVGLGALVVTLGYLASVMIKRFRGNFRAKPSMPQRAPKPDNNFSQPR